jgi:hypothetical protein
VRRQPACECLKQELVVVGIEALDRVPKGVEQSGAHRARWMKVRVQGDQKLKVKVES